MESLISKEKPNGTDIYVRKITMPMKESNKLNFWPARIGAALLVCVVLGSMGFAQFHSEKQSRHDLEDRFVVRASSASSFLDSYVQHTLLREQELAKARLGTPEISHEQFLDFLDNFGFGPSVLTDSEGKLIDVAPYKEDLIDTQISSKYTHLQKALDGELNVSNVVPSAALKFPIVAFAVPFETQVGTRVISGAFDLTTQPLGVFLENAVPIRDSAAYLIDEHGEIIASSNKTTGSIDSIDSKFSNLEATSQKGHFKAKQKHSSFYSSEPVEGTPWRVVLTVRSSTLFEPVSGSNRVLPWVFLACFAAVAVALIAMLVRGRERRLKLQDVALIDLLTGIYNPRGVKSHLNRLVSASRRHESDLTIFKISIDDFKNFNSRFGHNVGDEILQEVSKEIQSRLRTEDIAGRSSGKEFTVILPDTDISGATIVAERIRRGVEEDVRASGSDNANVTISIGISTFQKDDDIDLICKRAELALEQAKTSGKNKVVAV